MIKAIVFDLGGVLFAEGKSVAVERLARELGVKVVICARGENEKLQAELEALGVEV